VATRLPEELRLTPADAARLVEHEILARFEIRALPASRRLRFVQLAASDEVVGGRLHDAHIAAVASSAGAKIVVTENRRHFTSLLRSGIRVLTAKELVAEAL
jgi:predicted nucleic acid-binding protein